MSPGERAGRGDAPVFVTGRDAEAGRCRLAGSATDGAAGPSRQRHTTVLRYLDRDEVLNLANPAKAMCR